MEKVQKRIDSKKLPSNGYEKPFLTVNKKPIELSVALVREVEDFIDTTKFKQANLSSSSSSNIQTNIKPLWKLKFYNNTNIQQQYEKLQPKIIENEQILRTILLQIFDKKSALLSQAYHLVSRLNACIKYQDQRLIESETPINEIRDIIENLVTESSNIKLMAIFNNEILKQKKVQGVRKGIMYMHALPRTYTQYIHSLHYHTYPISHS